MKLNIVNLLVRHVDNGQKIFPKIAPIVMNQGKKARFTDSKFAPFSLLDIYFI